MVSICRLKPACIEDQLDLNLMVPRRSNTLWKSPKPPRVLRHQKLPKILSQFCDTLMTTLYDHTQSPDLVARFISQNGYATEPQKLHLPLLSFNLHPGYHALFSKAQGEDMGKTPGDCPPIANDNSLTSSIGSVAISR